MRNSQIEPCRTNRKLANPAAPARRKKARKSLEPPKGITRRPLRGQILVQTIRRGNLAQARGANVQPARSEAAASLRIQQRIANNRTIRNPAHRARGVPISLMSERNGRGNTGAPEKRTA